MMDKSMFLPATGLPAIWLRRCRWVI